MLTSYVFLIACRYLLAQAMNFLPIVERELRVRARRGVTHWARFALAAALALMSLGYFSSGALPPAAIARAVFIWLIAASFTASSVDRSDARN